MAFSHESLSLSDAEFTIIRDLIRERTGLFFENGRRDILAEKLSPRAIQLGFDAFIDYYYLLKYGPGMEEEWTHVLDSLSVQETYFWREIDQIHALVNEVVPHYFSVPRAQPLRIWSAACATGEEPLSIAMALNENGWFARGAIEILGSDGSACAVDKARQGVYRERSFRSLPPGLREKYFKEAAGSWCVSPELHSRMRWTTANLVAKEEVARMLPATVIFCRNVFIYFSGEAITRTIRMFSEGLTEPGYLFVGVSESLLKFSTDFDLREMGGAFVYVKK